MKANGLLKFFPVPKFLSMPVAGVDISDQSVKFAQVEKRGRQIRLVRYGEKNIPVGVIEAGLIRDRETLATILNSLREENNLQFVAASLPEEEAYVVKLHLPVVPPAELRDAIELQLEEHIPLSPDQVVFDYEVFGGPSLRPDSYEVEVSALPRATAFLYTATLRQAGLEPLALEIEAQAVARAVVARDSEETVIIVDFGKTRSSFFVSKGWKVLFTTTSANVGGEDLTKGIQKSLNLDYASAEKLKIEQGLLATRRNQELFYALGPIIAVLRDEIKKHLSYWEKERTSIDRAAYQIKRVIVCGGQSTLPGLVDYLGASLGGLEVAVANPWLNVFSFDQVIPDLNLNQALRYTTAIGLALRNVFRD